jgi:hypothetical protein
MIVAAGCPRHICWFDCEMYQNRGNFTKILIGTVIEGTFIYAGKSKQQ